MDALHEAGLANMTDVVVTYDDTSKRVTVRCAKGAILELRGDITRMFGFLNNMAIRAFVNKGFTLALPETGNQYFYVYTDIIRSQYHGDVVVPILHTVTVKGKHGSYVRKNYERPQNKNVPQNKKIFDTIGINIRDEVGNLVAFEHGKFHPLTRFNSMRYDNKPHNTWEDFYYVQAFLEESSLQRGVMFLFIANQCYKEELVLEVSSKVLPEVSCHH